MPATDSLSLSITVFIDFIQVLLRLLKIVTNFDIHLSVAAVYAQTQVTHTVCAVFCYVSFFFLIFFEFIFITCVTDKLLKNKHKT